MEIRFLDGEFDPHEYEGLVYNMPAEDIPLHLARVLLREGKLEVWHDQAFYHHDHQMIDNDDASVEEPRIVKELSKALGSRFPGKRFVIELSPVDRITWYQPIGEALVNDDSEWDDFWPSRHEGVGKCHKCGGEVPLADPQLDERHRGVRFVPCPRCPAMILHSTRITRFKVGNWEREGDGSIQKERG